MNTQRRETQWNNTFENVKRFMERQGKAPRSTCDDDYESYLGDWLVRQRRKMRDGKLAPRRKKLLAGIGALVPRNEPEFLEKLKACTEFIKKHGRPPGSRTTDPAEKALYYWRGGQMHLLSIGRLKPHRKRLLEAHGIFHSAFEYDWSAFFGRLKRFIETHGRPPIRYSDDREESCLGQWRQEQYALYKSGKMEKQRARMLEKLGIAVTIPDINWNRNFRRLQEFVRERKSLPYRCSRNEKERKLSGWLEYQKKCMRNNELTNRRRRLIESLDLPRNRLEELWYRKLKALQLFARRNGRLPSLKTRRHNERSLAIWCCSQRLHTRTGRLGPERIALLEELGVFLNRKSEQWKSRYRQVYLFIREHGRQPRRHSKDSTEGSLGRWCEHQRYLYSKGKQPKQRIPVLRSAGILR